MEDAAALNRKAEALIAEGDSAEGMPLLLAALDLDPNCVEALENLGIVAIESPDEWKGELFNRLETSVRRSVTPEQRKRALWLRLVHAAFFDEKDTVRAIANEAGALVEGDAEKRASIGALLCELGERERGIAELKEAGCTLGEYHLARLSFESGESGESCESGAREAARRRLEAIPQKGIDGILRETGILLFDVEAGSRELLGSAKVLIARAEQWEDPLGPHVYSEVLHLKLKVALAEGRKGDAAWAAEQLGMPASGHDPGAMLRAARLVGPLYRLRA